MKIGQIQTTSYFPRPNFPELNPPPPQIIVRAVLERGGITPPPLSTHTLPEDLYAYATKFPAAPPKSVLLATPLNGQKMFLGPYRYHLNDPTGNQNCIQLSHLPHLQCSEKRFKRYRAPFIISSVSLAVLSELAQSLCRKRPADMNFESCFYLILLDQRVKFIIERRPLI